MKFSGYIVKRKIENILMFPFILLGRILAITDPLPKEYKTFFFFPFYHTGGAEKVHALIAKAAGDPDCLIFFTRRSHDDTFLAEFKRSGCEVKDISKYVDNKWLYFLKFIWRGKITGQINKQGIRPVVFNGQSNFGYKIGPWIKKEIRQVELIHSFNSFSWIRIPFLPFITETVMISRLRIEEHVQQYKKLGIPAHYVDRIHFIQNAIDLPKEQCSRTLNQPIKALFVGRGTPEKRPELFVEIARSITGLQFTLVGEMPQELLNDLPANLTATGNINDDEQLNKIYCDHHLLIIPSSTEGFPIVLMEAMASGCVVMATPVGDIPYHIKTENGFLFSSIDERLVIAEAIQWLNELTPQNIAQLSVNAKEYAFKNFDISQFNQQYKAILQQ